MIVILGIKRYRVCGTMYSFLEQQNLLLLNNGIYTQVLDGAVLLSIGDLGTLADVQDSRCDEQTLELFSQPHKVHISF
jgi:hypothetical protein